VAKSGVNNLILAISERLNLGDAGVKIEKVMAKVVWFKEKIIPKDVLAVLE
jgi:predicted nuclease of restriction endonuclease-like RecB superfamily